MLGGAGSMPRTKQLSYMDCAAMFHQIHQAVFKDEQKHCFFRRTKVEDHWGLTDIMKHALKDNRSQRILINQLKWLKNDGDGNVILNESAPEAVKKAYTDIHALTMPGPK